MTRPLPTTTQVQDAMNQVLADAASTGRKATITAVERRLGVPHATFYRNFLDLIQQFQQRANAQQGTTSAAADTGQDGSADHIRRLRAENEDLRRTLRIYAEAIRQLTTRNEELQTQLHQQSSVTSLSPRHARMSSTSYKPPSRSTPR